MANERKFSIQEQIECVDREIRFNEKTLVICGHENWQNAGELTRTIDCLKAVRETLQFANLPEESVTDINLPTLEKSLC